jgi:hypothetical protein
LGVGSVAREGSVNVIVRTPAALLAVGEGTGAGATGPERAQAESTSSMRTAQVRRIGHGIVHSGG